MFPWQRYDGDYTSGWDKPKKKAPRKKAAKKAAAKPDKKNGRKK